MSGASYKWKTLLAVGGGATALIALVYYLRKHWSDIDTGEVAEETDTEETNIINPATATKDDVLKVLVRVIESQDQMKLVMKDLVQLLLREPLTFEQVYEKVKAVQPADPLEETRLTMQDFDHLLSVYQSDPEISTAIAKIMGMSNNISNDCGKAQTLQCDTIINIHKFMVKEIKSLIEELHSSPDTSKYDMKTVTIAIQAMVGARVEKEYDVTSEELELAVILQHQALSSSPDFACINLEMQSTISSLMGNQFVDPSLSK